VQASGWHLLFPDETHQGMLTDAGLADALLRREDVQFHWRNAGYAHFDEFLATLRSSRRKNVRRERRRIREQGIEMRRLCGDAITAPDWDAFYRCYRETYRKRSGHDGYLNRAFFDALLRSQREQLLLVTASGDDGVVGSALFLFDDRRLFGRYWGSLADFHSLHFEACYYQGIEYCIREQIARFEPGTQGEHKISRGFVPTATWSNHWLSDSRFDCALRDLLAREETHVDAYMHELATHLPYRESGNRPSGA